MTTRSRPITDYKRTFLMMKYIREYEELTTALAEMLDELRNKPLIDEELDKLNTALEDMAQEMQRLANRIEQYGGKM